VFCSKSGGRGASAKSLRTGTVACTGKQFCKLAVTETKDTWGDIPVEVRAAAEQHPGVTYQLTEPLAAHRLVIDALVERIRGAEGWRSSDEEEVVARRGTVYLVGAGPGDPGLLTVKARDLLVSCDAVVYDYLVNPEVLGLVPVRAQRVYVGKVGGGRQTPQTEINRLLVELARAGKRVVRLKGGGPFVRRGGPAARHAFTRS
jgi:hypothetical protein